MIGRAARSVLPNARESAAPAEGNGGERFERELACVDLAGFAWGSTSTSATRSLRQSAEPRLERKVNGMSSTPDVSVVLPTYNRAADLERADRQRA